MTSNAYESQNKSLDRRVFLSWGGEEAKKIGEWLKEEIFDNLPGYSAFISSDIQAGIQGGNNFFNRIHDELNAADEAIGIMTDVALDRPWFLYEIAYLKSKLDHTDRGVPLLSFGKNAPQGHPLYPVHLVDGYNFDAVLAVVKRLIQCIPHIDPKTHLLLVASMQSKADAWNKLSQPISQRNAKTANLRTATTLAIGEILKYKMSESVVSHPCMQELACKTLKDLAVAFQGLHDKTNRSYKVDYRRYPEYLMHLQQELNATTLAIAIVDDVEEFWAHKTGDEILNSTPRESQRIFVFENPELFKRYFRQILRHAERYSVFVMSSRQLRRVRDRIAGDFSLITDPVTGDRMAAFYDNTAANIQFTVDKSLVDQKLAVFTEVITWARRIKTPQLQSEWEMYEDLTCEQLFSGQHNETGQHSSVIPIEIYNAFEEEHPYYLEMQACMLSEFRKRITNPKDDIAVLEIGAGTGLFTKRLVQQPFPGMTIKAMEPDTDAHPLLLRKLQNKANRVQTIQASILNYDPRGEYKFVFSSFSEHHIRPEDKDRYFSVVTGTMEQGGYLIIGDEFLALKKTEAEDQTSYARALERYHTYIIDTAIKDHHTEVAELERMAMESGRPEAPNRIDFKVDLAWYKGRAAAANLILETEHCITPSNLAADIGGIYVLVFRKP